MKVLPHPTPDPALEDRADLHADRLRVVTLNVFSQQRSWDERRSVLRAGLRDLRPDLVAFQEVRISDDYDQVIDLLGPEYTVVHQSLRTPDGFGSSIASRWPVGKVHEQALHVPPRVDPASGRIVDVAVAEIQVSGPIGRLLFVHHKPSWQWNFERERELQAVAAAQFVEHIVGKRSYHVVLAGDFDASPEASSVRFWQGKQSLEGLSVCYGDAWERLHSGEPGHTFTPRNALVRSGDMPLERGRRIDYIMIRCGNHGPSLEIASCELLFADASDGVWASDHFGIVADLIMPSQARPGDVENLSKEPDKPSGN